jgi:hypothetical protein
LGVVMFVGYTDGFERKVIYCRNLLPSEFFDVIYWMLLILSSAALV